MSETAMKTAEERVAELEIEVDDLKEEIKELQDDLDDAEKDRKDLQADVEKLEADTEEYRSRSLDSDAMGKALELYADPANWDSDRRFVPVMKHIDADIPSWPAEQALKAAGI